ncbi:hypothetical protein [Limnohabitans sp. B9-3]|nr:hypothetical protein [Limnohabitans sp. B9-3]
MEQQDELRVSQRVNHPLKKLHAFGAVQLFYFNEVGALGAALVDAFA